MPATKKDPAKARAKKAAKKATKKAIRKFKKVKKTRTGSKTKATNTKATPVE